MTAPIGVTRAELEKWCGDDLELTHIGNTTFGAGAIERLRLEAAEWRTLWTLLDRIEMHLDIGHGDRIVQQATVGPVTEFPGLGEPAWQVILPHAVLDED